MTWNEFFTKLGESGIDYVGIDEDAEGFIVIHTNLKEKREDDGFLHLVREER